MDPSKIDFSFMKSGHDLLVQPEASDADKIKVGALITVFAENSIKAAFQYVEHAKRNGVTTQDLKSSMKLEVFEFLKRDNIQEQVEEATQEITQDFFGAEDEDTADKEDILEDEMFVSEEELDTFSKSTCSCGHCKKINIVIDNWSNWTPSNDLEIILKKHIDAMPDF